MERVMQLLRIREVADYVTQGILARWPRASGKEKKRELMHAIVQFGQLRHQVYKQEVVTVDVTEIAFRFRETRNTVNEAFALLEQHGVAQPTGLPDLWKLDLSDPQKLGGIFASSSF